MRYHNITRDDMRNGDGLRVVLWVSGCSHCCRGCQNQITWDPNVGLLFNEAARSELFEELGKEYISGITFSGGDPLYPGNQFEIEELAAQIRKKFPDKTIWLYTGSLWEEIRHLRIIKYLDILVDGEYEEEKQNHQLHWRGSENQRVIDVKKTLKEGSVVLYECR